MSATTIAQRLYRSSEEALRFLPEGPYPLGESRFSWVAIQHGADAQHGSLNVFDLVSSDNRSHLLPGRPGFAFPCDNDRHFIVGCERQVGLFDPVEGVWDPMVAAVDSDVENTIINDAVLFDGNLIFGTKDLEFQTKKAGLYLFRGADRTLIQLRDDQICSNGKAVATVDGQTWLYDIDSPTREIVKYRLDVAAGTLTDRQVVVDLTADPAVPDGMILTPDETGVIVSMYNPGEAEAGETRWYDIASGQLRHTWQTPFSPQNTCPNLVRHQGKVYLVITTAVEHMPLDRQQRASEAGSLFFALTDFDSVGNAPTYPMPAMDDPAS
ncbi:SMP-30/gluconolactonase/LRE family protein [Roseimaritima ulvae]|uniref:SMP-30/Gluconolaconase/LRE-like region n=1 Tax=Roseimaritima ulvae TaxID=980254 RepID=A0A5B9R6W7_9BACT|nr:SMP-30/gluconolactonase/LRE family protein [Roseimaritima ulvae]QEG42103.1 SMP-30/Gluconolaconase/LRE-like region [Roseimaritima ulvae]